MPSQTRDLLRPGERLEAGECLVSNDLRFRFYLTHDGPKAFAYRADGVHQFWGSHRPGTSRLELGVIGPSRYVALVCAAGAQLYSPLPQPRRHPSPPWEALYFAMQDDGNPVLYVVSPTGQVEDTWSLGTRPGPDTGYVPPNVPVLTVPAPGTILLEPGVGDTAVVNASDDEYASVFDGAQYTTLEPGQEVSATLPGTVNISLELYQFADLQSADGRRPVRSADALAVPPARPGQRRRLEIGRGGRLTLRGHFRRAPEAGAADALHMCGTNSAAAEGLDSKGQQLVWRATEPGVRGS